MRKIQLFLAIVVACSLVLAAGNSDKGGASQGNEEAGAPPDAIGKDSGSQPEETGNDVADQSGQDASPGTHNEVQTENQGAESQIAAREEMRLKVQQKKAELDEELKGMGESQKKVYQNQNQVRLAVHALLGMKDSLGGIGPRVSEIAREFDNSFQATVKAEEKIQAKSGLARFFSGGDEKAAAELESETKKNQEKLTELKSLKDNCDCGEEEKTMLQEQIQNMEQEQARLGELALKEKASKGILGWMWK